MRENADLALIRPVEASALVGGASGVNVEYRRPRISTWNAGPPNAQFPLVSFEALRVSNAIKRIRMAISHAGGTAQ